MASRATNDGGARRDAIALYEWWKARLLASEFVRYDEPVAVQDVELDYLTKFAPYVRVP